jgi:hypothetical protein
VSDLQIFHTVTSVEYPFADIMDICGKTDISKIHTLKKCAFVQKFQGLGKMKFFYGTKIKSLFSDTFQTFREIHGTEIFTAVKSTVFDEGKCGRQLKGFQGGTL